MYFDEMIRTDMNKMSEFSEMKDTKEILARIRGKTLDELEKQTEFPNPIYAVMRLDHLIESENQEKFEMLITLYQEKNLVKHLMDTQKEAIAFIRKEKPKMMEKIEMTENMKQTNPKEYEQMENNLNSSLREIAIKEFVEI